MFHISLTNSYFLLDVLRATHLLCFNIPLFKRHFLYIKNSPGTVKKTQMGMQTALIMHCMP